MGSEATWTDEERAVVDAVPKALDAGVELLDWWREADSAYQEDEKEGYAYSYKETKVPHRPEDTSYGFFDKVKLADGEVKVNGNVQEMFYDEAKAPPAYEGTAVDWMNGQVREFVLRYFLRISDYRLPEPIAEAHPDPPPGLGFLSQCPREEEEVAGFGYSQLYFKKRDEDEPGKFAEDERDKVVDLRRLDGEYEWIVLKNPIFSFGFDFKPLGTGGPQLRLPAKVFNYLVVSKEFVVSEAKPERGVRARYGFGYAFLDDPEPSVYGYGPGRLEPAFEQLVWEVRDSGEIAVRAAFVAREPRSILELSVDPFAWGFQFAKALGAGVPELLQPVKRLWDRLPLTNVTFDPVLPTLRLVNLLTLGEAARRFCISKDRIVKEALFLHFLQHYQVIVGSLQTWRQIPDWTIDTKDEHDRKKGRGGKTLPRFVVTGKSV